MLSFRTGQVADDVLGFDLQLFDAVVQTEDQVLHQAALPVLPKIDENEQRDKARKRIRKRMGKARMEK